MTIVIQLAAGSAHRALAQWLGHDIDVAHDSSGQMWLRVTSDDPALPARLARLPGRFFRKSEDGKLIRWGDRVASAVLDDNLHWQRLDDVLQLELPVAALAGRLDPELRSRLRLVRGGKPAAAAAAIVSMDNLSAWVELASQVRLTRLRWIVRGGEALVMGDPLPPIVAQYFVAIGRVLVPAGWHWQPSLPAGDLSELFGVRQDQWLIWEHEQRWSIVSDDALAMLRRAAVRHLRADQSHQVTT